MKKLLPFLRPFRKQVFLGPMFKLIEAIFELIVPIIMAKILDIGVGDQNASYIVSMGGILILLSIVGLCSTLVCQKFAAQASQGVGTNLRNAVFQHVLSFSPREIDQFGTNSLITRLTLDINQLQYAVAMLIRLVVRAPFLVIGAIVMAMFLDLPLSIVFLIMAPIIGATLFIIMAKTIPYFKRTQEQTDRVSRQAGEALSGARVIRAYATQETEQQHAEIISKALCQTTIQGNRISSLLNPFTYLILNLAIAAVIWFGGVRVEMGAFSQGEVVAFVNYLSQILVALVVVANLVITFTKAAASAQRINEIFETKASVQEENQEILFPIVGHPSISFQNVSFSYHSKPVLQQISFSLSPGKQLGIIGGTGAGKSTIAALMLRNYDAQQGEILIHGIPIQKYSFAQLRRMISVVPQKTVLFTGSVADNLRFRDANATPEEMRHALSIAQCDFILNRADGLKMHIVEGGKNLSGGQRQRLTIARALIGHPEILILDDSASALDYATDAKLRQAISKELQDMALIIISQRISSIQQADEILVLDHGKIAGMGTHESLCSSCKIYEEIVASQTQKEARP